MVHDLVAGTDAAICVVFDPEAVKHLAEPGWKDYFNSVAAGMDRDAEAGNLVIFATGSDGTYKMRAYVDEEAPPELLARAFHEERGGLLRVPSGRLCSDGMEYLPLKEGRSVSKLGTEVSIPAGDYLVDAYLLEPNWKDERVLPVDDVTGWGCLATVLLLPASVFFLWLNDWRLQVPSVAILALLTTFWVPVIRRHRSPSVRAARAQLAEESTPSLLLVMRRLADGADRAGMKGIVLKP